MSFLDTFNISKYFDRSKFKQLNQQATEAVVDALVMAMACDGDVDADEVDEVLDAVDLLDWKADEPVADYVHRRMEVAREADPEVIPAECKSIASRAALYDWLAEEIYYLAARVAEVDDTIAAAETFFLSTLSRELQLDRETQRLTIQRIRHESM